MAKSTQRPSVLVADDQEDLLSNVILTLVSTAAWILPVRRALRVDPMIALRNE